MPTYGFINPGVTGPNPIGAPIVVGPTAVVGVAPDIEIHTVGGETGDHDHGEQLKLLRTNTNHHVAPLKSPNVVRTEIPHVVQITTDGQIVQTSKSTHVVQSTITGKPLPRTPSQQVGQVTTVDGGEIGMVVGCGACALGICAVHGRRLYQHFRPSEVTTATRPTGRVLPDVGMFRGATGATGSPGPVDPEEGVPPDDPEP
jgi:hypothetical protein